MQRACAKCGELFWPRKQQGPKKQIYCSPVCENRAVQKRYRDKHWKKRSEYNQNYYREWWQANKASINERRNKIRKEKTQLLKVARLARKNAKLAIAEANKALQAAGLPREFLT